MSEEFRTLISDVEAVFETNAELAVDDDRRLVTEAHAWLNWSLVAAHEVGPFVAVEADAMTGAMGQAGHFVVRTKAGVSDHFARRRIDGLTRSADLRGGNAGILRFAFKVPNVALTLRWFSENKRARDVRLITFDATPAIH